MQVVLCGYITCVRSSLELMTRFRREWKSFPLKERNNLDRSVKVWSISVSVCVWVGVFVCLYAYIFSIYLRTQCLHGPSDPGSGLAHWGSWLLRLRQRPADGVVNNQKPKTKRKHITNKKSNSLNKQNTSKTTSLQVVRTAGAFDRLEAVDASDLQHLSWDSGRVDIGTGMHACRYVCIICHESWVCTYNMYLYMRI